jgi:hypothetical protein
MTHKNGFPIENVGNDELEKGKLDRNLANVNSETYPFVR